MRKQVLQEMSKNPGNMQGQIDVAAVGTVLITSEAMGHSANNIFDGCHGPGASRWVAAEDGDQTLVVAFDEPQSLNSVELEVEEVERDRSQELLLSVSCDGGRTYREVVRQGYNFSPAGTTF